SPEYADDSAVHSLAAARDVQSFSQTALRTDERVVRPEPLQVQHQLPHELGFAAGTSDEGGDAVPERGVEALDEGGLNRAGEAESYQRGLVVLNGAQQGAILHPLDASLAIVLFDLTVQEPGAD